MLEHTISNITLNFVNKAMTHSQKLMSKRRKLMRIAKSLCHRGKNYDIKSKINAWETKIDKHRVKI